MAPAPGALNAHVLAVVDALPRGGGYEWPSSDPKAGGCLADLTLRGETVLRAGRAGPSGAPPTFCCGLTLEILWRAWEQWARETGAEMLGGITVPAARALKRAWFCEGTRKGPVDALLGRGLGVAVPLSEALPGDFAQLWRSGGSGHSVVVLRWEPDRRRLAYLSTQKSTGGIGARTESLPPGAEVYVARAIVPGVVGGGPRRAA